MRNLLQRVRAGKGWVAGLVLAGLCGAAEAGTWTPDPALPNPELHRRVYDIGRRYCDAFFDPAVNMVRQKPRDHYIRESAYYAYGLLITGDPEDRARALAILPHVLAGQDTRPESRYRGAFLWRAEDTWETIANPDENSAAFVGEALAAICAYDRRHPVLTPELRQQVDQAGKLAVEAILRRNVDPGYSNIAILSTAVAAAGETLWHVPGAAAYAERKLDAVLKLAGDDGACYEYLSPTYMAVNLAGAYGARKFAFSDAFAARAETLISHLWKEVALSYHPATYQLAGPHNRAYGDNMLTYAAGLKYWIFLANGGDYPLPELDKDHGWDQGGLLLLAEWPVTTRPEFKQPVPAWREITAVGPDDGGHPTRRLFQYRTADYVLGTVQWQDLWRQKRNLVAYWRAAGTTPETVRVGYCIDQSNETLPGGFPPAQAHFRSHQVNDAALVVLLTSPVIPGRGGCNLVFAPTAVASREAGGVIAMRDGAATAYVYPVTAGGGAFQVEPDTKSKRLTRAWNTADVVADTHVLAYLLVLRKADQPAPQVSNLVLKPADSGGSAHAVVDGVTLQVPFKGW